MGLYYWQHLQGYGLVKKFKKSVDKQKKMCYNKDKMKQGNGGKNNETSEWTVAIKNILTKLLYHDILKSNKSNERTDRNEKIIWRSVATKILY